MFCAKPHSFGAAVELDGSDKQEGLQDLATLPGAALLQAQDFGQFANPDGASAAGHMGAKPALMGPVGSTGRAGNVSGKGVIQNTAKTTAPMSNPFPAPKSSVRTNPSTIAKQLVLVGKI